MRRKINRVIVGIGAAALMGVLFQTACAGFAGSQALQVVDFCFLFDCQNGALGGLLDPCSGGTANLFVDCPADTTTP
jgi:hypothetical protein